MFVRRSAALTALLFLSGLAAACGNGGNGDAVPSPAPTAAPVMTASPAGSPSPSGTSGPVHLVMNFFTTVVPNAHTILLSAWDLSTDLKTALTAAAHNGADVTVITPFSQDPGNHANLALLAAAGVKVRYEYTSAATPTPAPARTPVIDPASVSYIHSPMDIHAKFAVVDGGVYLDGHNWFASDVVVNDTDPADMAAVQADLSTLATPAPSGGPLTGFTTDKQISLHAESDFLQNVALPAINSGTADEFDFILESFNPKPPAAGPIEYNDDVAAGLCQIASSSRQPSLRMVFENEFGYAAPAIAALQDLLLLDPANANVRTNANGHEKISMIRKSGLPLAAWFGSSNSTTTDLFDWGMTTSDPALLAGLATYFDTVEFANSTAIAGRTGTPAACATIHP